MEGLNHTMSTIKRPDGSSIQYNGDGTLTMTIEITALDIPTMGEMGAAGYRAYLDGHELFWVDHHDVLRSVHGEYPIAVKREQMNVFIEYLQNLRDKMDA